MKKNILHVVTTLQDGGLEKIVFLLVSSIKDPEVNHHCAVLVSQKSNFLKPDFIKAGVNVKEFNFVSRSRNPKFFFNNLIEVFRLAAFIKKTNADVIHSHDFFPAFVARCACAISFLFYFYKPRRIYVTLHNTMFWLNSTHHLMNRILGSITSKIICVSEAVRNYSIIKDKVPAQKYQIIYNGVNIDDFTPDIFCRKKYRDEFNIREDEFLIGNVGVLSLRKGQKYLIHAFAELLRIHKNIRLLIFGSMREHEKNIADDLRYLINSKGLSEKAEIIEPRKDLNLIYNIFDLFIMPSITEGLSLSAIEAMLMEKTCLVSDIPPFREMFIDSQNGYLFQSQNSRDLFNKMNYLITNQSSLIHIGKNARETAVRKYNVNRMEAEYRELYFN